MSSKKVFFLILIFFFQFSSFAQKIEEESRVSEDVVPEKALTFVSELGLKNKTKWYKERTSGRDSYECKFKANSKFYSVEFDTLGVIEDIEVLVKKRKLTQEELRSLESGILKEFEKFKWVKIQRQFKGTNSELNKLITDTNETIPHNFEVELEGKSSEDGWKMYELLLSPNGEILMKREIQLRPTDNLNY
ncbi:MAG: hypothetical protein COA32_15255 [Fluviicola sp.]|nr:MAG: hypothetical protein COA32_15255 [Fluviicola sp.]